MKKLIIPTRIDISKPHITPLFNQADLKFNSIEVTLKITYVTHGDFSDIKSEHYETAFGPIFKLIEQPLEVFGDRPSFD